MTERMRPDAATKAAERAEAHASAVPGEAPSDAEARAADDAESDLVENGELRSVEAHYREMTDRGAHQEGEGRID